MMIIIIYCQDFFLFLNNITFCLLNYLTVSSPDGEGAKSGAVRLFSIWATLPQLHTVMVHSSQTIKYLYHCFFLHTVVTPNAPLFNSVSYAA